MGRSLFRDPGGWLCRSTAPTHVFCRIAQRQAEAKQGQESAGCADGACRSSAGFARRPAYSFYEQPGRAGLRWAKVQQKIAGTFRSVTGVTAFCRIRSYLSTMQKQGHSMLSALTAVFHGQPLPVAWGPE